MHSPSKKFERVLQKKMLSRIVLLLLSIHVIVGMVDLFQNKLASFRGGGESEHLGCETMIVDAFKKLNGTGHKVNNKSKKNS